MMQTTFIGQRAEAAAASYLETQGYRIIKRNWRRRDCEIDIIAHKGRTMHFVEVKYRMTDVAGSGLEYITAAKLRQMAYAARRWVGEYAWRGEYVLSAVEVAGEDYGVTAFIDCIDG
jgi:putative endonuclease